MNANLNEEGWIWAIREHPADGYKRNATCCAKLKKAADSMGKHEVGSEGFAEEARCEP